MRQAAERVRFALASTGGRARLVLEQAFQGIEPFDGIRVDQLELDVPGTTLPSEISAGPSAFKNRRLKLKSLRFSISEEAATRHVAAQLDPDAGAREVSLRVFSDHVRLYAEVAGCRFVTLGGLEVDEAGRFAVSFYEIRCFGRLPRGQTPAALFDRLLGARGRPVAERTHATRFLLRPYAALLGSWLPAAGWKIPDTATALDRQVTLRGDRIYFQLAQSAAPGLVAATDGTPNLAAFEHAEAERLFDAAETRLRDGDLAGAAAAYAPYADPRTGHPFALRRLAWIRAAEATGDAPDPEKRREAMRLVEAVRARLPDDPWVAAAELTDALSAGEAEAAVESLERISQRSGDEGDLRGRLFGELLLGELYATPGPTYDLALARGCYESVLRLDPGCASARQALGAALRATGEPARAVEEWTRVLEGNPETDHGADAARGLEPAVRRWLLLAIAETQLDDLGDPDKAIPLFRMAQEGDEAHRLAAWEGLARAYAAKGDAPAAIRQLERVAERCAAVGDRAGAARAQAAIGILWSDRLSRPENALLRFERALALDPGNVDALARLFRLRAETGRAADALKVGRDLADAHLRAGSARRAVDVLLEVSRLARSSGDPEASLSAAARALEIDPDAEEVRRAADEQFRTAGEGRRLAELYATLLPRMPPSAAAEFHLLRARVQADLLHDADAAVEDARAALQSADAARDVDRQRRARELLVELFRREGRQVELREIRSAQWADADPETKAAIALDLGTISRALGEWEEARGWYERAAIEASSAGPALAALADLAAERGDAAGRAEALLRRAALEPDGARRVALRVDAAAVLLEAVGDHEAAKAETQRAIDEAGEEAAPAAAWKVLGSAQRAGKELDAAARSLERWHRRLSADPSVGDAARAAAAREVAAVHAERDDDAAELDWIGIAHESKPVDLALVQRGRWLADRLGDVVRALAFEEAEAAMVPEPRDAAERWLAAGRRRDARGEEAEAERDLRAAFRAAPGEEAALAALVDFLTARGRVADAVNALAEAASAATPDRAAPRLRRAAALETDPGRVRRLHERVLELVPDDPTALAYLADAARRDGDWRRARERLEKLAEATPDLPAEECAQLAMRRGEAAERDGDVAAAAERYRLAAALAPKLREPWKALRAMAIASSRFEDATDACEEEARRAESADERLALLQEAGRLALDRLRQYGRAVQRFRDVLAQNPRHLPALDALEGAYAALDDPTGLLDVLLRKVEVLEDPKRRSELLLRAAEISWKRRHDVDAASEYARRARLLHPGEGEAFALQEAMLKAERRHDRLSRLYEEEAEASTDRRRVAFLEDAALLRAQELGDFDGAARLLERAIGEGPGGDPRLLSLLADVHQRRGDGARLADTLLRLGGAYVGAEKAAIWLRLARVREEMLSDPAGSLAALREAHEIAPDEREVVLELRAKLFALAAWNDLAEFERALADRATDSRDAAAGYRRSAVVYRDRLDDGPAAVRAFRRALELDPFDREALAGADGVLAARGDHATRARIYRTLLSGRSDDAELRDGYIDAMAAAGSWTELEADLKPVFDAEPVTGPAVSRLLAAYRAAGRHRDRARYLEARVAAGEADARLVLEESFAEREDWRGLAEFYLRQAETKRGRARAEEVARASAVFRDRLNDLARARGALRDAIVTAPEDAELFDAVVEVFERAGDMEGLRDFLLETAEGATGGAKGELLRRAAAITRERLADGARAFEILQEILARDPDDDLAAEAALEILSARADGAGIYALWMARGEKGTDPARRAAWYRRAAETARDALADPARTASAYRAALVIDPDDGEAARGAERAFEQSGRWDDLASFRIARAARLPAGNARGEALFAVAVLVRDRIGDGSKALELFRQATAERPADPSAVDAAAAILASSERWDELASWLLKTAGGLAEGEAAQRRLDAAEVLLDRFPGEASREIQAIQALAQNLYLFDFEIAIAAFDAAVTLLETRKNWTGLVDLYNKALEAPTFAAKRSDVLHRLALLTRDRLEDPPLAVRHWRRALELDPRHEPSFAALDAWFRGSADWSGLLDLLQRMAECAPDADFAAECYVRRAELKGAQLADGPGAAEEYERALKARPEDLDLMLRRESALADAGLWGRLVQALLARAAGTEPDSAAAAIRIRAADILADQLHDDDAARTLYEETRATAAHPDEPLVGLERIYRRRDDAARLAETLLARGTLPGEPSGRSRLLVEAAMLRRDRLNDVAGALETLTFARTLDPGDAEVLRRMREIYRDRDDWAAIDATLEAEEELLGKDLPDLRAALAYERALVARDGFRDLPAAIGHLSRAVELDPEDWTAARALAESTEVLGNWPVARREWSRLATGTEGEERAGFLERAAVAALKTGEIGSALAHREDAVEANPDDIGGWERLSATYLDARQWQEARIALGELLARTVRSGDAGRTVSIYFDLARAERQAGHGDSAIARLTRLLEAAPDHREALELLLELRRERGLPAELAETLRRLLPLAPDERRPSLLRELGHCLETGLGRPNEALEVYLELRQATPQDAEVLWRVSELAWQNARHALFLETWPAVAAAETAPARRLALAFRAGDSLKRVSKPAEAAQQFMRALEIDPTHPPSWLGLADVYEEAGEWPRAAEAYAGAVRNQPPDTPPETAAELAIRFANLLADRLGDFDGAAAQLAVAVRLKPDDLELRLKRIGTLARTTSRGVGLAELLEIARRDPLHVDVLRLLAGLYVEAQEIDRAFVVHQILQLIDRSATDATTFLEAHAWKLDQEMKRSLDELARSRHLTHPFMKGIEENPETSFLRASLAALSEPIAEIFPAPFTRDGLVQIDFTQGSELEQMVTSTRLRLGMGPMEMYWRPSEVPARRETISDLLHVEAGEPPAFLIDDTVATLVPDRRGALFVIAKYVERMRSGLGGIARLSAAELARLALLVRKAFDPRAAELTLPGVAAEAQAEAVKAFRKRVPRRARREVEMLAVSITADLLRSWCASLRHTENRAGLLVGNDIAAAVQVIFGLDRDLARLDFRRSPDPRDALRRSDEAMELLRFCLSEDYFALRKSLGLAFDRRS